MSLNIEINHFFNHILIFLGHEDFDVGIKQKNGSTEVFCTELNLLNQTLMRKIKLAVTQKREFENRDDPKSVADLGISDYQHFDEKITLKKFVVEFSAKRVKFSFEN